MRPVLPHVSLAILLALPGLAAYSIFRHNEEPAAAIVAVVLTGAALGLLYRPPLRKVFALLQIPAWHDLWLLFLSMIHAYLVIGLLDLIFRPAFPQYTSAGDLLAAQMEWILQMAAVVVTLLPFARQVAMSMGHPDRDTAAWRASVGLVSGALMGLALFFAWVCFGKWAFSGRFPHRTDLAMVTGGIAVAGMFGAIGAPLWWQALSGEEQRAVKREGLFNWVLISLIAALLAAILLHVALAAWQRPGFAVAAAILLDVVTIIVWCTALWRVGPIQPATVWRGAWGILLLALLVPLSLTIPASIASAGDWAPLYLIIAVPATLACCAGIMFAIPPLLRPIFGPARQAQGANFS